MRSLLPLLVWSKSLKEAPENDDEDEERLPRKPLAHGLRKGLPVEVVEPVDDRALRAGVVGPAEVR